MLQCDCVAIVLYTFNSARESNLTAFHMMYTRSSADIPIHLRAVQLP